MQKNRIFVLGIGLVFSFFAAKVSFSQKAHQNYFGKAFFTNINGSYVFDKDDIDHRYNEYTMNIQVGVQLLKSLFVGVETLSVFTNGTSVNPNTYLIKGGFIRYELLHKRQAVLFIETSLLKGDYCTCRDQGRFSQDPYRYSDIYYLGVGIGAYTHIAQSSFYVNVGLSFNKILNAIPLKTNYNIPKIGVGYFFGKNNETSSYKVEAVFALREA